MLTAINAINTTNEGFGCADGIAGVDCAIEAGATIGDYAGNGLGGGLSATGGQAQGLGANAFAGINPNYGEILLLQPVGRAVYNALQVSLRSQWSRPAPSSSTWSRRFVLLSRLTSGAQDLDFVNRSTDFLHPNKYNGPDALDRTHQFSAGVVMDLPWGFKTDFITHWYSALPQNIIFNAPGNAEDIFQYDFTGTGQTPSDAAPIPIPGSTIGAFGRSVKAGNLDAFLQKYSSTYGNQITPAGQALVNQGLMTAGQLESLCAITPSSIRSTAARDRTRNCRFTALPGALGNSPLFTFDMTIGYAVKPIRSWEWFSIEPEVSIFNLFNRANFNDGLSLQAVTLDGQVGSVGATTAAYRGNLGRIGLGSGAFSFGSARTVEFGVRLNF